MAKRLHAIGTRGYENGFELSILPERLSQPLKRKIPTVYFVNSMSDLFHKNISFEFLDQVFEVIKKTPQHSYQILTKRPARMSDYFSSRTVPENVWLGVTVEDKKYGLPRIDILKGINAKTRFLSAEPLLEDLGELDLSGIHWVIVGGESGSKARAMKKDWVLSIKKQCTKYRVSFFFKQWGTWGSDGVKRDKKKNGRKLSGRNWDAYPAIAQFSV
jgi:protein gp37